jgi:hypothetical protein
MDPRDRRDRRDLEVHRPDAKTTAAKRLKREGRPIIKRHHLPTRIKVK